MESSFPFFDTDWWTFGFNFNSICRIKCFIFPPNDYYAVKTDIWDHLPSDIKKKIESSLPWFEEELEKSLQEQERRAIDVASGKRA